MAHYSLSPKHHWKWSFVCRLFTSKIAQAFNAELPMIVAEITLFTYVLKKFIISSQWIKWKVWFFFHKFLLNCLIWFAGVRQSQNNINVPQQLLKAVPDGTTVAVGGECSNVDEVALILKQQHVINVLRSKYAFLAFFKCRNVFFSGRRIYSQYRAHVSC